MEIRCDVVAEKGKEGGDRKSFVAIGYDIKIDRMPVKPERKEGGDGVNGYHEENSDDTGRARSVVAERREGKNITVSAPMVWYNVAHAWISRRKRIEWRSGYKMRI